MKAQDLLRSSLSMCPAVSMGVAFQTPQDGGLLYFLHPPPRLLLLGFPVCLYLPRLFSLATVGYNSYFHLTCFQQTPLKGSHFNPEKVPGKEEQRQTLEPIIQGTDRSRHTAPFFVSKLHIAPSGTRKLL